MKNKKKELKESVETADWVGDKRRREREKKLGHRKFMFLKKGKK